MGGMFDPVHEGHMQLAERARAHCGLDAVKLIPVGTAVHRDQPVAAAEQRIAMLELAAASRPWLQVDPRECRSAAPSYTFDTATALHAEHPDARLFLLLGLDAFLAFDSWHRWQELLGIVHLLVAVRPGYSWESCRLERGFRQEVNSRRVNSADAANDGCGSTVPILVPPRSRFATTPCNVSAKSICGCCVIPPPCFQDSGRGKVTL